MNKIHFLFLLLTLTMPSLAKARYMEKDELITHSELICVVEVTKTEEASKQGDHWKYGQKATVKRVQTLKGAVPKSFEIYAQKNFICSSASFKPGRYLVFLRREKKGFLISTNHAWGALPVENGQVMWYGSERYSKRKLQSLEKVISKIGKH